MIRFIVDLVKWLLIASVVYLCVFILLGYYVLGNV